MDHFARPLSAVRHGQWVGGGGWWGGVPGVMGSGGWWGNGYRVQVMAIWPYLALFGPIWAFIWLIWPYLALTKVRFLLRNVSYLSLR